jgi:hypothetical protein
MLSRATRWHRLQKYFLAWVASSSFWLTAYNTRPALFTEIACKDVDPNQFVSVFHLVAEITRRTASFGAVAVGTAAARAYNYNSNYGYAPIQATPIMVIQATLTSSPTLTSDPMGGTAPDTGHSSDRA